MCDEGGEVEETEEEGEWRRGEESDEKARYEKRRS